MRGRQHRPGNFSGSSRYYHSSLALSGRCGLLFAALLFCALLSLALPASAQTPTPRLLTIKSSATGDLLYWYITEPGHATKPLPLPPAGEDGSIHVEAPASVKEGAALRILDAGQGRIAHLKVDSKQPVTLADKDFDHVMTAQIPVKAKDKPVAGLLVSLQAAGEPTQQCWLNASDNGTAHFTDVPLNTALTVLVSNGKKTTQAASLVKPDASGAFTASAVTLDDWKEGEYKLAANAPATPASVPVPAAGKAAPAERGGGGGGILNLILGLLVAAGIGYAIYRNFENGKLAEFLAKRGIQVAPLAESDPNAPSPFTSPVKTSPEPIPLEAGTGPIFNAAPTGSGPRLVATLGAYAGSIFPLNAASIIIGRDPTNTVPLPQDTSASRHHARIQANSGEFVLVDEGSSNGTYVNGVRIANQEQKPLHPGDEVQIGTTRFRFEA